jgi:Na+/H+ antiporter NhaD/arsenite permease-like protein
MFGLQLNVMALAILCVLTIIGFLFYRMQKTEKLDFADMITKDGRGVSLTKILQLVGGMTATWVIIKLTLTGGLTETILGIYLAYVAGVEGYSKFVAAKYNYRESSVKDARVADEESKV